MDRSSRRHFVFLAGRAVLAAAAAAGWATARAGLDFQRAVARGDARAVRRMLQEGQDPNEPADNGQLPLYLALQGDSLEVAEVLLADPRTQIDRANDKGETPLMMAALKGQVDMVQRLVARGAAVRRAGWSPLHYAASGPQPQLLQWLVDKGAELEAASPNRTTPLMMAAGYGSIDGALLLLGLGADARARNDAGLDAAAFARRAGRDRLAEQLESAVRR